MNEQKWRNRYHAQVQANNLLQARLREEKEKNLILAAQINVLVADKAVDTVDLHEMAIASLQETIDEMGAEDK